MQNTFQEIERLLHVSLSDPNPSVRREAVQRAQQLSKMASARGAGPQQMPAPHVQHRLAPAGPYEFTGPNMRAMPPHSQVHLDQIHPPMLGNFVAPMIPPSRILTLAGTEPIAANTVGNPLTLDFTAAGGCDNGMLIGMHGTVKDDTVGVEDAGPYQYANMAVRIAFNSTENLITDGEAASFVPFSDLFSPGQRDPFPIYRMVSATDKLFVTFQNLTPAGGNALTPSLSFLFLRVPYPGT